MGVLVSYLSAAKALGAVVGRVRPSLPRRAYPVLRIINDVKTTFKSNRAHASLPPVNASVLFQRRSLLRRHIVPECQ